MPDQESRSAYLNARKLGRKYLSDYSDTESKGYLQILDSRLRDVVIVGEINLGHHEIALSKIIGTKTAARSNSFAGNFMPLLTEDTEFAIKWRNVYQSQLKDGIREPVAVYEYINRFYVLEGNKRVSILKYVGAASIYGSIIRLIPERDESNLDISIYYEFLDYDRRLYFDNLWFSKKGNFTRLVREAELFLDSHNDLSLGVDALINQVFRTFRSAYKSLALKNVSLTSGDALVEYIKIFGFPFNESSKVLRKNIKNTYSQLLVVAGEKRRDMIEISEKESSLLKAKTGIFKSNNKIRICAAFEGNPHNNIWTSFHARAIDRVERKYKEDLTVERIYNVRGGNQAYEDIAAALSGKADMLFTTSPTMANASLRLTLENPGTVVLNCDNPREGVNLHTYYWKMYDLTFLCGILAAAMSETGKIGYMSTSGFERTTTYDLNAFGIGARLINPNAQVLDFTLRAINDWDEHNRARAEFAALGADVAFCRHSPDNPLDRKAFPEVYAQLYSINRSSGVPVESLAAATLDWEPFYDKVINDAILGKASLLVGHIEGNPIHFGWGFSTGIMDIFPVNNVIGVAGRLLRIFRDLMRSGNLNPFEGPIFDNEGNMRIDWGYVPTLMEIQKFDWREYSIKPVNY